MFAGETAFNNASEVRTSIKAVRLCIFLVTMVPLPLPILPSLATARNVDLPLINLSFLTCLSSVAIKPTGVVYDTVATMYTSAHTGSPKLPKEDHGTLMSQRAYCGRPLTDLQAPSVILQCKVHLVVPDKRLVGMHIITQAHLFRNDFCEYDSRNTGDRLATRK